MPVPDVPVNEDSMTIHLDLTIPFLQEEITDESFEQEPEDINLESVLSSHDSVLMEDTSDTLCNNIIDRYSVSSIFNLDVHLHGFEKVFNSMLREVRCD